MVACLRLLHRPECSPHEPAYSGLGPHTALPPAWLIKPLRARSGSLTATSSGNLSALASAYCLQSSGIKGGHSWECNGFPSSRVTFLEAQNQGSGLGHTSDRHNLCDARKRWEKRGNDGGDGITEGPAAQKTDGFPTQPALTAHGPHFCQAQQDTQDERHVSLWLCFCTSEYSLLLA